MRKLGMISAVALLVSAGNAFASTASLSVGGNGGTVLVPEAGLTGVDVRIDLLREGSTADIGGFQTGFVADATGITINPSAGGTAATGTGTRYNGPAEWDSNTAGNALNPNTTTAGVMAANSPRGDLATLYAADQGDVDGAGHWIIGDSIFGWLNITLAPRPAGTIINLTFYNQVGADNDTFGSAEFAADGVTFEYVPEPASALLLLAALPFMRRRRTA